MAKHPRNKSIFIDIDGTLISRGVLNETIVTFCKRKKAEGFDIILWSARGREYAETVAAMCGITDLFTAIIGKPGYVVDDLGWNWIKYTKVLTLGDIE